MINVIASAYIPDLLTPTLWNVFLRVPGKRWKRHVKVKTADDFVATTRTVVYEELAIQKNWEKGKNVDT